MRKARGAGAHLLAGYRSIWEAAAPAAVAAVAAMRGGDNAFDEVWVEPGFADEIDCACVSHFERTLFVFRACDSDDGHGRLLPPDLARGLDAIDYR